MIAKASKGSNAGKLLRYLFEEPGRAETHTDPRLVASWDSHPERWEPPRLANGKRDLDALTRAINEHLPPPIQTPFGANMQNVLAVPKPVYHMSVSVHRADPERGLLADPRLSDEQFAEVVTDLMTRVGLHKDGAGGVKWVAARHDRAGETHAHVVAVLANQSGSVYPWNDYYKLRDGCRAWEERLNLRRSPAAGESQRGKSPTRGEMEKARARGMSTTFREAARHEAVKAARDARTPDDFTREMRRRGVETHVRRDPKTGRATGFAVRAMDGVWFKGSHLDRDLKKLMGRLEALSRTVDNTRELQSQATRAASERRDAERDARIRRAYTLPGRAEEMAL